MHTEIAIPETIQLYIQDLDSHIVVENHDGRVVIRVSRDNLSESRKASFVRHLASEGHIPDRYKFFSESRSGESLAVRWVMDSSPAEGEPELERRALRREWGVILLGFAVFVMLRWWLSPHVPWSQF